jgi:hypothetical protein
MRGFGKIHRSSAGVDINVVKYWKRTLADGTML